MRLTQYTDYALRTLIYLACHNERKSIDDLQRAFFMSRSQLTKVVHQLGQLGYLTTSRGKYGGLELARTASSITAGEIVRAFEPDFQLLECFDPERNTCPIAGKCLLQGVLGKARTAFMRELDQVSIADLSANRKTLISALSSND